MISFAQNFVFFCQSSETVVNFMIKLPVDLSDVPPYIVKVRREKNFKGLPTLQLQEDLIINNLISNNNKLIIIDNSYY